MEEHFIKQKAEALSQQLIEWRRHLHANPELSFQEIKTAEFLASKLSEIEGMQVEVGIGKTGVVGTLSAGEGPTIAIRADIDALPITEENEVDYCSKNEGVMHACGHDAHPTIGLGVATLVADLMKQQVMTKGTVKFIFQPAEESTDEKGLSGAPYMILDGVLEGVDAVLALHMCPWLPVGGIQVNNGYSMANVDVFQAKITGTGGHGAYPQLGTDPIWMLGLVLQAIHGIVARKVSPLEPTVISIGQVHAGTASNIIPTEVVIKGTMRSYSNQNREHIAAELERAISIVDNLGGSYELTITKGEPSLKNDPIVNGWILHTVKDLYPSFEIVHEPFGLGGEDFGYMSQIVPSAMFFLGCALSDGIKRDLHTPTFNLDERCLPIGVAILTETVRRYVQGEVKLLRDTTMNWRERILEP
ncbi:M20 metallopeptidase family protein [Halalkalibacterium ligniniphilum]|uniref:M20 metallopeptidase family protein n=1 Tax=Halalkalibacterium ligniniphilum TaxID=1134413 RepID=UPI00034B9153|nr:M20 family metallopeptidase [Halalkalibacterium ligniniphilum]